MTTPTSNPTGVTPERFKEYIDNIHERFVTDPISATQRIEYYLNDLGWMKFLNKNVPENPALAASLKRVATDLRNVNKDEFPKALELATKINNIVTVGGKTISPTRFAEILDKISTTLLTGNPINKEKALTKLRFYFKQTEYRNLIKKTLSENEKLGSTLNNLLKTLNSSNFKDSKEIATVIGKTIGAPGFTWAKTTPSEGRDVSRIIGKERTHKPPRPLPKTPRPLPKPPKKLE